MPRTSYREMKCPSCGKIEWLELGTTKICCGTPMPRAIDVETARHGWARRTSGPTGRFADVYSGYNPALGCHTTGKHHFEETLKQRGLHVVESDTPPQEKTKELKLEESDIFSIKEHAPDFQIEGNEAQALLDGKDLSNQT